jgi:hypothetical protein
MAKKTTSSSKSKAKTSAKSVSTEPVKAARVDEADMPGQLRQLAEIRAKFPALPESMAASLFAHHDAEACREKGNGTRAVDVFRGGMSWARTFGQYSADPALSPKRVRWFLDCLTVLGESVVGRISFSNPSEVSSFDDVARRADKVFNRAKRRLWDAVGSSSGHRATLQAAFAPEEGLDARLSVLRSVSKLVGTWIAAEAKGEKAPALAAYDVDHELVGQLDAAAKALDDAMAKRPAGKQTSRDTPAMNEAEGRVLLAMRPLWDDLAEAREDGLSSLQVSISPALLRGLDIGSRKKKTKAPESPQE